MIVNNKLKDILSDPNKNIETMSKKELTLLKNEIIRNPNRSLAKVVIASLFGLPVQRLS